MLVVQVFFLHRFPHWNIQVRANRCQDRQRGCDPSVYRCHSCRFFTVVLAILAADCGRFTGRFLTRWQVGQMHERPCAGVMVGNAPTTPLSPNQNVRKYPPTDASLPPSRTAAHGSGLMWIATPSSRRTCTDYSFAGLPGALRKSLDTSARGRCRPSGFAM
jgi:hypothetical protein